jgi:TDG/mug DNA glycosylase family protein
MKTEGFSAVSDAHAKVLILGSMPGQRSLAEMQYYAHPRNAFWPIMGSLFNAGPEISYAHRLDRLRDQHIALWDVLKFCERPGSLDSAIKADSAIINNFDRFFACHPEIQTVFFNGKKAAELYRRHMPAATQRLITLPSTSPANAAMSFAEKLRCWSQVANPI